MQLDHDLCSPSRLDLRYFCPGSARMEQQLSGTGKSHVPDFTSEGTRKHGLVQRCRDETVPGEDDLGYDVQWVIDKVREIADPYAEVPDHIIVDEYQIDLADLGITGGKEGCRIDLLVVVPGRKALIIDYKFGVMYVPRPKYNWQMKAYAVGVFRAFGVSEIEVIILQPNTDEQYQVKTDFFYAQEIDGFERDIKAIVAGTKAPDAPVVRGDHCTSGFCRARDTCPLWRDAYLALPVHTTVAAHLKNISPEQRKILYENVVAAKSWCEKARSVVELLAINGEIEIDGYEIGTGRKSREWASSDVVAKKVIDLAKTLGKECSPYALKSPAEIEAELGKSKAVKEALQPLVIYKEGKPALKKKAVEA
jgi:Protein of unknown function (DUF2800)